MPSTRQLRTLVVGVIIGVVFVLFYTSHLRQHEVRDGRTLQDFYHKTVSGLDKKPAGSGSAAGDQAVIKDKDGDGNIDADDERLAQDMADRLKEAAVKAKEAANKKAPLRPDDPSDIVGIGTRPPAKRMTRPPLDGRCWCRMPVPVPAPRTSRRSSPRRRTRARRRGRGQCHSQKITRHVPLVLILWWWSCMGRLANLLDEHPIGKALQDFLAAKTGRSTVPNVLINSVSIGGFDDVHDLDERQKLVAKIIDLGQKRVTMVQRTAGAGAGAAGHKSS
ncbi:glutaredoxin domain-containing protein [Verticillium dahliae VdLs.17]|uniref:Glutaredoxin domain-containing protein n=1 Tax=Verticillium dahliae (strain VdLs.17 / ATCC MYA-4575 / FGSC 10137) TaxID=498257 RepID=G2WZ71_VERDV|nr:glutaredoxin domain-containing protein [Verticillium dahliae VdLs.17]EGY21873.1 glutaredoxin domain-containing protein [Verticillium dahliae VdLs.17]